MSPSDRLQSHRPHDGTLLWEGGVAQPADVAQAVARARAAQPAWEEAGLGHRIAVLEAFRARVEDGRDALARLIAEETGKPLWETQTEVASVAAKVGHAIAAFHERTGTREGPLATDPARATQSVTHRPHGVLAVLGPYNFPAHLPNGHIAPALLAGNAIVFKPSELTPATGAALVALWHEAGLPPDLLGLVQGDASTGRALAAANIDGLLFTGSATTGLALARQFAEMPHRILALELGGNNPLVCWDVADADIEAAAATIVQSAFLSAGQRCTCARRLILPEGAAGDRLLDATLALVDRLIVGAPFDEPPPFMGPVIDNRAADRLLEATSRLEGRALRPLRRIEAGRPFLSPSLLDMTAAHLPDEELFGPVLAVRRVASFEAALSQANATRFGLSAALLGGDAALWRQFRSGVRAGVVNWNRPTNGAASNAPFGGVGLSGNHRPSAWYAADYCAWPMASVAADRPSPTLGRGLR